MQARLGTPKAKRMKKLRQATVEPVLGTLVNFLGMKRVNTGGIGLANKCMLMAAACYNLKKLLHFNAPKAIAKVKAMVNRVEQPVHNLLFTLFAAIVLPALYCHRKLLE